MSPPHASAKVTLDYPLYASDFDPKNHDFLLVGGGGGESRSGVGNKITLLNASKKNELSEVIDITLSKEEDSVTTLGFSKSTQQWATAFAGINSSSKDQNAGKNEHLRSFMLGYPPRKNKDTADAETEQTPPIGPGLTKALGRVGLFTPSTAPTKETFQRVLRISKKVKDDSPQMGVVATGLAPEGEVVAFDADSIRPTDKSVRARFDLGEKVEAADVDIVELEKSKEEEAATFRIAYCTDYDIYLSDVKHNANPKAQLEPRCIFGTGHPDVFASTKTRPKFRSLRFLTPSLLLVLQNLPQGKGAELILLEISGIAILRKRLHKAIKSATGLAISRLPYPKEEKLVQHAIAVAGADLSITVLTLDHPPSALYGKLTFHQYIFLPQAHPLAITSLSLSTHVPPTTAWAHTAPQYLKLASTSISNTAVVHTFPMTPHAVPPPDHDVVVSYLLRSPTHKTFSENFVSVLIAILAIGLGALFLQVFTEIRGGVPEYLGAKGWLSPRLHGWLARPYMFESSQGGVKGAWERSIESEVQTASSYVAKVSDAVVGAGSEASEAAAAAAAGKEGGGRLRDLLARKTDPNHHAHHEHKHKHIVIRHDAADDIKSGGEPFSLKVDALHTDHVPTKKNEGGEGTTEDGGKRETVTKWEDLSHEEKEGWKRKLQEAGEWTLEEGEAVLKGVFFSGLAGVVGAFV